MTTIYEAWHKVTDRNLSSGARALPLEDYVTEVLAVVCRENPQPLLQAMQSKGLLRFSQALSWEIKTQQEFSGGILDLQLQLVSKEGEEHLFWFEMKVNSDARVQQNENYLLALAGQRHITLIGLAKKPLCLDIPLITWTDLVESIDKSELFQDSNWHEFKQFLYEIMAAKRPLNLSNRPRMSNVFQQFAVTANQMLLQGDRSNYKGFPTGEALEKSIDKSARSDGKFACSIPYNSYELQILASLDSFDDLNLAVLCKRIKDKRAGWNLRPRIIKSLSQLNSDYWQAPKHDWVAIESVIPRKNLSTDTAIITWFSDRWRELISTNIPDLLEQHSK